MANGPIRPVNALEILSTTGGRAHVRERIAMVDHIDPMELKLLNAALSSHSQSILWSPGLGNINSILTRLLERTSRPKIFESYLDTPGKSFIRINACGVDNFLSQIERGPDIRSTEISLFNIDKVGPLLFESILSLTREYSEKEETDTYAVTSPNEEDSGGDVMLFNLPKMEINSLMTLGQSWNGVTAFYAQGPKADEVIHHLRMLLSYSFDSKGGNETGGSGSIDGSGKGSPPISSGGSGSGVASFGGLIIHGGHTPVKSAETYTHIHVEDIDGAAAQAEQSAAHEVGIGAIALESVLLATKAH